MRPPADERAIDPHRTVVFHMEPLMWTDPMRRAVGQLGCAQPTAFLQVRDHRRYRNSGDWWRRLELRGAPASGPPPKSTGRWRPVFRRIFRPGSRTANRLPAFPRRQDIDLDIYGSRERFRRWRSRPPLRDKRVALLPYRYYFDAENNSAANYYTEKIVDCLLAETLCFYWGCPNLDSFFDPARSSDSSLTTSRPTSHGSRQRSTPTSGATRLPLHPAEKQRILEEYQFFPTLARVLDPARVTPLARRPADRRSSSVDRRAPGRHASSRSPTRTGTPEVSETLDVERRLDWSGLCLEADEDRCEAGPRPSATAPSRSTQPMSRSTPFARNGLAPAAIDWLNLAVASRRTS